MLTVAHPSSRRRRRHGPVEISDRHVLEQAGWRTLLDYRENHIRDHDGTLLAIEPRWTGEAELERASAERADSRRSTSIVVSATADSPAAVWAELRQATAEVDRAPHRSVA